MMDLSSYFCDELIIPKLKAKTKTEAIKELVSLVYAHGAVDKALLAPEDCLAAVLERERMQSTGIGNGLGFPHARIDRWNRFVLAIGISPEGLDFDSVDKQKVHFVCLMLSSTREPYIILQAMSAVIRCIQKNGNLHSMLTRDMSPTALSGIFKQSVLKTTKQILAKELARPVKVFVYADHKIEESTRLMHLNQTDVLPVVSREHKFLGEVSCLEVFKYGMPQFFQQLHTISFIRHVDPFEKYFQLKKNLTVEDLMHQRHPPIPKEATLMEIVFLLTVKNRDKLFVVEDNGKLFGVIDRFTIIDKILFF